MMTTSSVASLRAAPTMAVYGLACVFLYVVPAIVFLLPTVAGLGGARLRLGRAASTTGCSQGISKPMGFLAVWCQFAMTIFYYPSLLGFVASTLAYVINPALASQRRVDGARHRGRLLDRRLGLVAGHQGRRRAGQRRAHHRHADPRASSWSRSASCSSARATRPRRPMDAAHLLPEWAGLASLVLIVNNFLSYSGMEMNAVHVSSLRNPGKEFPQSMFLAMGAGAADLHPARRWPSAGSCPPRSCR